MIFSEKYISKSDKDLNPDSKKKVVSDDTFALCEMIENLINAICRRKT